MVREALTMQTLAALEPAEAAALFIARRAEGLTSSEQQMLADWLAKDEVHRRALANAERAWQSFERADEDEILTAMRTHAPGARPRSAIAWHPAVAAAAILVLAVGVLMIFPALNPWAPGSR